MMKKYKLELTKDEAKMLIGLILGDMSSEECKPMDSMLIDLCRWIDDQEIPKDL